MSCPVCGEKIGRVRRKFFDRVKSLFVPLKRYRCDICDWSKSLSDEKNIVSS